MTYRLTMRRLIGPCDDGKTIAVVVEYATLEQAAKTAGTLQANRERRRIVSIDIESV